MSKYTVLYALAIALLPGCQRANADKPGSSGSASPGVSATEIVIGQTMPYSGPASAYGNIGKTHAAYFRMINDEGGINGRKLNLISLDDGYAPPKTVEQTRRLVERDNVAFIFNVVGTAPNSAIQKYLNEKGVPQLFVASGAEKWNDPGQHKWTMGWQPSYRIEARIYAKHIASTKPDARVCLLYQNDDFGKDYMSGLQDSFGEAYATKVIKSASYEVTDPSVDSQVVALHASGCDTLVTAATPKFAAQTIRKVHDIGWKPMHIMSNVSGSIGAVLRPAGVEKAVGLITGGYLKDISDPAFQNDPGVQRWRAFMDKYLPDADRLDANFVYGYAVGETLVHVLQRCGDDLSRENILAKAASIEDFEPSLAMPGTKLGTSASDYRLFSQMQLARFNGETYERFGEIMSGE
jgi:branched-chain amino acid transport system substrate-binding protein